MRRLIIFAKCPKAGKVKTRLTPYFSLEDACQIYQKLAAYTFKLAYELSVEEDIQVEIAYTEGSLEEIKKFVPYPFSFREQQGKSLGERMSHQIKQAYKENCTKVVLIGTDCPEINKTELKMAYKKLSRSNVTIGPSFDGGYYLIGFNSDFSQIFQNISWSTEKVFHQTLKICEQEKINRSILKILHDLDTPEDYQNLLPTYPWLRL